MRRSGISSRVHATKVAATKVAATNLPFSPRHSQSRVDTLLRHYVTTFAHKTALGYVHG